MRLNVCRLGRMEYGAALAVQLALLDLRQRHRVEDTLLLVEHPPVLTLGVRGDPTNVLATEDTLRANGVSVHRVERGGDVTYHGPGQIVGYPIIDLNGHGRDIKRFVWNVEEVFIRLLQERFGIAANREEKKYTGVWVGHGKITAIGIAVKRWVTFHGFAFNVNTDLEHFRWINPCGITDRGVTSLEALLGHKVDFDGMNAAVAEAFAAVFGMEAVYANVDSLLMGAGEEEECQSPNG